VARPPSFDVTVFKIIVAGAKLLNCQLPREEFGFTFAGSGRPGGQNVNKVSSKAVLSWAVLLSPSLPEEVRARFLIKLAGRVTSQGKLILTSQKYRDQARNVEDWLEKLAEMIAAVPTRPTPRRPTRPGGKAPPRRGKTRTFRQKATAAPTPAGGLMPASYRKRDQK